LFEVHGRSLIERQIDILRDQLGLRDLLIVVGHLKEEVRRALGSGERLGVTIQYPEVRRPEAGPACGLLEARALLTEPFVVFLGDEFHLESHHARLLDYLPRRPEVLLTYTAVLDPWQIHANFSIEVDGEGHVLAAREKPERLVNNLCGCGTLYLTPWAMDRLAEAEPSARTGRVELYEAAAGLAAEGKGYAVDLADAGYCNVNTLSDLERARFRYRSRRFSRFTVSVALPAWEEAESIGHVVRDFLAQPGVVEVLVADNESADGTAERAREAGARVLAGRYAGYGDALRAALNAATGDILVACEADYTFRAADLPKLLEYLKDADAALGTRTCRPMIAPGAQMRPLHRLANVALAKYLEALWWPRGGRFTDVGCTYRALWKETWGEIRERLHGRGADFCPEMMIELIRAGKKCIEVPVGYHRRYGGVSRHGGRWLSLARTAWRMWRRITGRRLRTWLESRSEPPRAI